MNEEIEALFGELEEVPGEHELNGWGDDLLHEHLYAITVNGRIGLLYSNKDYSSEWNFHARSKTMMQQDLTKFGINLIVYALTR